MIKIKMSDKMEMVPIKDIRPYKRNPRNNTEAIPKVAESILKFGFRNPIILDKENVVIAGHTRLLAAKKLGLKEVPCIWANDLTPDEVKALRLVDNKTAEYAEWELDLLNEELNDINLDLSAFDFDIDMESDDEPIEVQEDDFDEETETNEHGVKQGDIWQLGRHRLMCGDSTSKDDTEKLMNGKLADMVFTDPPYGIDYSGGRTLVAKKSYGKIKNDDLEGDVLGHLICNVFNVAKDDSDVYICVSPINQKPFLDYLKKEGKETDAVIVWDKKVPGLGYMKYRRQCEFILFVKGKDFHKGDKSDFDLWSISRDDATTYQHGTQKPIGVSARAIVNSSEGGGIITDLFGGSGSTLIACEQTNRQCYMMELDPHYCDVIISRWEKLTGQQAVKVS